MTTFEAIRNAIMTLAGEYDGEKIPVGDLLTAMEGLFVTAKPLATDGLCAAQTKAGKPCSKKGTKPGSDGLLYCGVHVPAGASTPPKVGQSSPAVGTGTVPPVVTPPAGDHSKVTGPTTCQHQIKATKGKEARQCDKKGKEQAPDGAWYCGTHLKSHSAKVGGNDNAALALLSQHTAYENDANLYPNYEFNVALDKNGICHIADWEGKGPSAFGRLVAGVLSPLSAADTAWLTEQAVHIVPEPKASELLAMSPADRAPYLSLATH